MRFVEATGWPPTGPVQVWEEPIWGHAYVIGADTAEGLEHGDYSDASVLDKDTGLMVAKWHDHIDPDLFGQELANLGHWYNTALIGVEINNHGHTTVAALRRVNYPRLFRRRVLGQVSEKFAPQWGWQTNKVSKPLMINDLNTALREGSIDVRDEHTIAELLMYVREQTTGGHVKMHGSPFDDRVMSLAIAVQMLPYTAVEEQQPKRDKQFSFDWWVEQAKQSDVDDSEVKPIGWTNVRPNGTSAA